eukprot:5999088-Amphidinium_carterae.1
MDSTSTTQVIKLRTSALSALLNFQGCSVWHGVKDCAEHAVQAHDPCLGFLYSCASSVNQTMGSATGWEAAMLKLFLRIHLCHPLLRESCATFHHPQPPVRGQH